MSDDVYKENNLIHIPMASSSTAPTLTTEQVSQRGNFL